MASFRPLLAAGVMAGGAIGIVGGSVIAGEVVDGYSQEVDRRAAEALQQAQACVDDLHPDKPVLAWAVYEDCEPFMQHIDEADLPYPDNSVFVLPSGYSLEQSVHAEAVDEVRKEYLLSLAGGLSVASFAALCFSMYFTMPDQLPRQAGLRQATEPVAGK